MHKIAILSFFRVQDGNSWEEEEAIVMTARPSKMEVIHRDLRKINGHME